MHPNAREHQHRASGAPSPAREDTGTDDSPSDGEESSTEKAADVDKSTAEGAATKDESKDSAEDAEGESSEEKKDEEDDSQGSKKKNLLPGLYVLSEVKLHVISGLQVKVRRNRRAGGLPQTFYSAVNTPVCHRNRSSLLVHMGVHGMHHSLDDASILCHEVFQRLMVQQSALMVDG